MERETLSQPKKQLSVALCMRNLEEAKELSLMFRRAGVLPHVYTDLRSFWSGVIESLPHLCVVDVQRMQEGDLGLRSHPLIKNQQLPVAFYYSLEMTPLLESTYDILNLGYIQKQGPLAGQLKAVLKRANLFLSLDEKLKAQELDFKRIDSQREQIVSYLEEKKEAEFYTAVLRSWVERIDVNKHKFHDFFELCGFVFESVKEIDQFSFLKLSQSQQKLEAPQRMAYSGYQKVGPLWLGSKQKEGIELHAQNMACQVAVEFLKGNIISLLIKNEDSEVEGMVFLSSAQENIINRLDWEWLESTLSSCYQFYRLKRREVMFEDRAIQSPWQLFEHFDRRALHEDNFNDSLVSQKALIDVNFSSMIELLRTTKPQLEFYWNNFINDFIGQFKNQHKVDFILCPYGLQHLALLVKRQELESLFSKLKGYSLRFPYWKYFESAEILMAKKLKPEIRTIPFSRHAYFNYLNPEDQVSYSYKAEDRQLQEPQSIVWDKRSLTP